MKGAGPASSSDLQPGNWKNRADKRDSRPQGGSADQELQSQGTCVWDLTGAHTKAGMQMCAGWMSMGLWVLGAEQAVLRTLRSREASRSPPQSPVPPPGTRPRSSCPSALVGHTGSAPWSLHRSASLPAGYRAGVSVPRRHGDAAPGRLVSSAGRWAVRGQPASLRSKAGREKLNRSANMVPSARQRGNKDC